MLISHGGGVQCPAVAIVKSGKREISASMRPRADADESVPSRTMGPPTTTVMNARAM